MATNQINSSTNNQISGTRDITGSTGGFHTTSPSKSYFSRIAESIVRLWNRIQGSNNITNSNDAFDISKSKEILPQGVPNLGNTCFINASLQAFFLNPSSKEGKKRVNQLLNKEIYPRFTKDSNGKMKFESKEDFENRVELQKNLRDLVSAWETGNKPEFEKCLKTLMESPIFKNKGLKIGTQSDPDEFLTPILDALPYEALEKNTIYENRSKLAYNGETRFSGQASAASPLIKVDMMVHSGESDVNFQSFVTNKYAVEKDVKFKLDENDEKEVNIEKTLLISVPKEKIPNRLGVHLTKYQNPDAEVKGILAPFNIPIHQGLDKYAKSTEVTYQADAIICREQNIFLKIQSFIVKFFGKFVKSGHYIAYKNSGHYVAYKKMNDGQWFCMSDESVTKITEKELAKKVSSGAVIVSCSRVFP